MDNKDTPLLIACRDGNIEKVKELINQKVNLDEPNYHTGWTPLLSVACRGNFEICKLLVNNGANKECTYGNDGRTPLYWSSRIQIRSEQHTVYTDISNFLIEQGANIGSKYHKPVEFGTSTTSYKKMYGDL